MRRFVSQVYAAIIIEALFFAGVIQAEAIHWAPDLEVARSAAKVQKKLLLLHFWTPDCGPCKQLEETVFPNAYVGQAINRGFIPLKVNAYRNPELRDHFRVDRWPTDVIATPEGQLLHSMITPQNPDRYIHELMTVLAKHRPDAAAQAGPLVAQQPAASEAPAAKVAETYQSRWSDAESNSQLASDAGLARRPGIDYSRDENFAAASRFGGQAAASQGSSFTTTTMAAPRAADAQPSRDAATVVAGARPNSSFISNPHTQPSLPTRNAAVSPPSGSTEFSSTPGQSRVPSGPDGNPSNSPSNALASVPGRVASPTSPAAVDVGPINAEVPPVGLEGRCPVTLIVKGTWKKGDPSWGAIHRGRLYLFAGQQEQRAFLNSPDKYSPVLAGMDVVRLAEVGKIVQGVRQYGVLFDDDGNGPNAGRIYLFDSEETLGRFEAEPDAYLGPVMQALQRGRLHTLLR